jgi:hypothetical protein
MNIETILNNAMTTLFNTVGENAIYTSATGTVIPDVKIWVQKDVELQPFDFNGQAVELKTVLECLLSQVLIVPQRGATFLVGSTTYTVQSVLANDRRILKLVVK